MSLDHTILNLQVRNAVYPDSPEMGFWAESLIYYGYLLPYTHSSVALNAIAIPHISIVRLRGVYRL